MYRVQTNIIATYLLFRGLFLVVLPVSVDSSPMENVLFKYINIYIVGFVTIFVALAFGVFTIYNKSSLASWFARGIAVMYCIFWAVLYTLPSFATIYSVRVPHQMIQGSATGSALFILLGILILTLKFEEIHKDFVYISKVELKQHELIQATFKQMNS